MGAYSNTFEGEFQFDDYMWIVEYPLLRTPGAVFNPIAAIASMPRGLAAGFLSRWVGFASFGVDVALHGLDARGFHLTNLLIHLGATLLVYTLVLRLLGSPRLRGLMAGREASWFALAVAGLFALHPIQTQAVTYIVQRFASLATMLGVASMVVYLGWRNQERRTWLPPVFAGALMLGSMLTKQSSVTFPLLCILAELLFYAGSWRSRALGLAPLAATAFVVPGLVLWGGPVASLLNAGGEQGQAAMGLGHVDFLLTELAVVATYLRLLVWPAGQNLFYDYPIYHSMVEPRVLTAAALHLAALGTAVACAIRMRRHPAFGLVAFGIAWFYVALAVESGAVVIVDVINEHRLYYPSIGAFIAFVATVNLVLVRMGRRDVLSGAVLGAFAGALLVAMATATYLRNEVWRTEVSMWTDVAEKTPKIPAGYFMVGLALQKKHLHADAVTAFRRALAIDVHYGPAYLALAQSYRSLGLPARALHADAVGRLAGFDVRGAMALWEAAIQIEPANGELHYGRALALERTGLAEAAADEFQLACRLGSSAACAALTAPARSPPVP